MQNEIYGDWLGRKDCTKCPVCKMRVEKTQGCQHIVCPVCSYEWCWICGLSYHSTIHQASGGMICELIGGSYFSFKGWKKYSIIVLLFLFFPLIIFIFSLFVIGYSIVFVWRKVGKLMMKFSIRNLKNYTILTLTLFPMRGCRSLLSETPQQMAYVKNVDINNHIAKIH